MDQELDGTHPPCGDVPSPLPEGEPRSLSPDEMSRMAIKRPGPVTLQDREGVFVHSFKCSICDLEFVLFSWRAHRHGVGSVFCPECGERTPMIHWAAQVSESVAFRSKGPGLEIFRLCPPFDGQMMDDTIFPDDDRYTFPGDARDRPSLEGEAGQRSPDVGQA